ncbi:ribonuclease Z [Schleiferia thermophila]|uniref:ribonuclease Z n=1 Tax=Schleiferia thermophila TaxID=884107 RepID=UPI002FDA97EB
MSLSLTILGSSSATPTAHLFPSSQWLEIQNQHFLIDCGEGAQMQIRKNKLSFARLNAIFISHAHGDHFFGLMGLLSSLDLMKRQKELLLFAPQQILDLITSYFYTHTPDPFSYPLTMTPIQPGATYVIYQTPYIRVITFPLSHTIPCQGFAFEELFPYRNIRPEKIKQYSIPVCDLMNIKKGSDWTDENGRIIPNHELTLPPPEGLKYVYCTDTAFVETLRELAGTCDLLYHEATYKSSERHMAPITGHSTTIEAARAAQMLQARYLLIGHFSTRYKNSQELVAEARSLFPNTFFARQNTRFALDRKTRQLTIDEL